MRSSAIALWLYGVIFATFVSVVHGDTEPDFMSVRKNVTKEYKSKTHIPTEKYFRELISTAFGASSTDVAIPTDESEYVNLSISAAYKGCEHCD